MKKIIAILLTTIFIGINPTISNGESYLDKPFNSNIRCEICEQSKTELEIWYDSNNIKHYTCLGKCTNGLDILYGPNVREKDTIEEDNNDIPSDEIVYWTRGKSYHKSSRCYHYVNAKYHYKGSKSECPKYDPCDDCCY